MKIEQALAREQVGPRFAYVTDLHARKGRPKRRKDNFHAALLEKLEWVCQQSKALNCSRSLICGGDVFNEHNVDLDIADDLVELLISHDMVLASVFGNHDIAHTLASVPSVVLGHLMRRAHDHVRPLPDLKTARRPYVMQDSFPKRWPEIEFWGHHYSFHGLTSELFTPAMSPGIPRVIVSHSMLLERAPNWDEDKYKLFADVHTNAHLILLGHYHPQQKMQRLTNALGTLIGGPGALMRGTISRDDLTRTPAFALCEWNPSREEFEVDFIDIEAVRPAEEVFRMEEVRAEREHTDALESFREELSDLQIHGDSVASIIEKIAESEELSKDVKAEALRRIGVA